MSVSHSFLYNSYTFLVNYRNRSTGTWLSSQFLKFLNIFEYFVVINLKYAFSVHLMFYWSNSDFD